MSRRRLTSRERTRLYAAQQQDFIRSRWGEEQSSGAPVAAEGLGGPGTAENGQRPPTARSVALAGIMEGSK